MSLGSQAVTHPGRVEQRDEATCAGTQMPAKSRATLRAFPMLEPRRRSQCLSREVLTEWPEVRRGRSRQCCPLVERWRPEPGLELVLELELERESVLELELERESVLVLAPGQGQAAVSSRSQQSCKTGKEVLSVGDLRAE